MSLPESDEFDKKLQADPLRHKGFTDQLQLDIEQAVDRKEKSRNRLKPYLIIGGFTAAIATALLFPWSSLTLHKSIPTAAIEADAPLSEQTFVISSPPPVSTAVLIGLRTEHKVTDASRKLSTTEYSTYRTMLFAPVKGELRKTSEGSGILMPYKQSFWKIDSLVHRTATEEIHYLSPHLAEQPAKPFIFANESTKPMQQVETLVFAGNEYVSIVDSKKVLQDNTPVQSEKAWVRTLPQLKEKSTFQLTAADSNKSYTTLTDLYGDNIRGVLNTLSGKRQITGMPSEISNRNWLVSRSPGEWVAKALETYMLPGIKSEEYITHDFPRALPDNVSNHDKICCSWSDIQTYWPNAKDALTSPMNDLIVVFENDTLQFYPYGQVPNATSMLSVDLKPGEQLVMAQWATDHYVQEWITKVDKLLQE
ncbi:hypothetical protein D3C73_596060 [compost metagenome]